MSGSRGAPAPLAVGCRVRVHGLVVATRLNGTEGVCTGADAEPGPGRLTVQLDGGATVRVRPHNLARALAAAAAHGAYTGGSGAAVLDVVLSLAMPTATRADMMCFVRCGQLSKQARHGRGLGVLGYPCCFGAFVPRAWGLAKALRAEHVLRERTSLMSDAIMVRHLTRMRHYVSRPVMQAAGLEALVKYATQTRGPGDGLLGKHAVADKLIRVYVGGGCGLLLASMRAHARNEAVLVPAIKLMGMMLRLAACSTMHIRCCDVIFAHLARANAHAGCEDSVLWQTCQRALHDPFADGPFWSAATIPAGWRTAGLPWAGLRAGPPPPEETGPALLLEY